MKMQPTLFHKILFVVCDEINKDLELKICFYSYKKTVEDQIKKTTLSAQFCIVFF